MSDFTEKENILANLEILLDDRPNALEKGISRRLSV